MEIHQLVEVCGAHVMSQKEMWIWCIVFSNGMMQVNIKHTVVTWISEYVQCGWQSVFYGFPFQRNRCIKPVDLALV